VTLTVHDSTLGYVVQALTRQAHLRVIYAGSNPIFAKRVDVHVERADVMDALAIALRGTHFTAKLAADGETVLIRPSSSTDHETESDKVVTGSVTGRVMDSASGKGINGATVTIKGTHLSVVTNERGVFVLRDVPIGKQVLEVKLFGYMPVSRVVTVVDDGQVTVQIVLTPTTTVLSGVVTTATGTQRKIEVGNDITTLNVDSLQQVAPITSVTDLLATRVPGLTVLKSSGVPGAPSRLRLRGVSSVTRNNDPIVIVDGVRVYASQSDARNENLAPSKYSAMRTGGVSVYSAPSPLDQIDPANIATIEVFKGPSASALYGSDAASGVIVITTKHGRAGPTQWHADLGTGVNWIPNKWPVNYFKFGENRLDALAADGGILPYCTWYDTRCTVDSTVPYQALNDPRTTVFGHGSNQTASLSISGGVPTLQYNLTGSTANTVGYLHLPIGAQQLFAQRYGAVPGWIIQPDHYRTTGASGSLTAQPMSAVHVTVQSSLFSSQQQQSSLQNAIGYLQGQYIGFQSDTVANYIGGFGDIGRASLLGLLQNNVERVMSENLTSTSSLAVGWMFRDIAMSATGGLNSMQRTDRSYVPFGYQANTGNNVDTTGSYGLGRGVSQDKTLGVVATIPSRFVTVAVGANMQASSTQDFRAFTDQLAAGISDPTQFLYTNGGPTQSSSSGSTYGWYIEPRFNFHSRFFVAPGFRLDGGSAMGANGGVGGSGLLALPKLDFSWVAIDRDHQRGIISFLRPRIALGVAGTQPGPIDKYRLYSSVGSGLVPLNDSTTALAVGLYSIGNTHLVPETSRELEGGADVELLDGRIAVTVTGYKKDRHNAILQLPVALSVTGTSIRQSVNIGEVTNTGVELTTNLQLLQRRALSWTVGLNASGNRNRLTHLAPSFVPNRTVGIVEGYPLFSVWARPIVAFADANGDGILQPQEIAVGDSAQYVGESTPTLQWNMTSDATFFSGRLGIHVAFSHTGGMVQDNAGALASGIAQLAPNRPGTTLATQAAYVAASCLKDAGVCNANSIGSQNVDATASDIGFLQIVNAFRFDALSVNYTLSRRIAQWLRVPSAVISVQGSNLGLHTNYRGADPNVNAFSTASGGDHTVDTGQLPAPRTWWLKLTLGN
jgi:TonB-linked SusC/RagA family outer membrane protein